jgi:formamidopyrimidine-DNA glycosylase
MPELPDIELYLGCLRERLIGATLQRIRIASPSLLRSVDPPLESVEGAVIGGFGRVGKRIVLRLEGRPEERFLVLHLMIAGRLRWSEGPPKTPAKRLGGIASAAFETSAGTLTLTEASTQKRATLHLVVGAAAVAALDPGGIEPLTASREAFIAALSREGRTIKRALTDPRSIAGIGNAYSDEILHAARLSPLQRVANLDDAEWTRLWEATTSTLATWCARLREESRGPAGGTRFPGPGEVTAFRPDFAVHGKFGKPCPVCGTAVQRIVRGDHETNYCPRCQTGGKVLADRSLSLLLKDDWPSRAEDWE